MDKAKILHEAQTELQRHVWGTYVDKGVSVALGGNGIVVPGCEACRKRINTNSQYLQHLAEDVLPGFWSGRRVKVRAVSLRLCADCGVASGWGRTALHRKDD
jgi:hypothetical protein